MKLTGLLLIVLTAGCAGWTPEDHARFQAQMAAGNEQRAASNAQFQQTFNMMMSDMSQTQRRSLSTTSYTPVQQSNGTWVRCVMVSSDTASCIAY